MLLGFLAAALLSSMVWVGNGNPTLTLLLYLALLVPFLLLLTGKLPKGNRLFWVVFGWCTALCLCSVSVLLYTLLQDAVVLSRCVPLFSLLLAFPFGILFRSVSRQSIPWHWRFSEESVLTPIPAMLLATGTVFPLLAVGQTNPIAAFIGIALAHSAVFFIASLWVRFCLENRDPQPEEKNESTDWDDVAALGKSLQNETLSIRAELATAQARLSTARSALTAGDYSAAVHMLRDWSIADSDDKRYCVLPLLNQITARYVKQLQERGISPDIVLRLYRLEGFSEISVAYYLSFLMETTLRRVQDRTAGFRLRASEATGRLVLTAGCTYRGEEPEDCSPALRRTENDVDVWCEQTVRDGLYRLSIVLFRKEN